MDVDEVFAKGEELVGHIETLLESITTLFEQPEYDDTIKALGINFKADLRLTENVVGRSRLGSLMSLKDMHDLSSADFDTEQQRRKDEFLK